VVGLRILLQNYEMQLLICDNSTNLPQHIWIRSISNPNCPQAGRRRIRRNVPLLLGYYNVLLHGGIIRYAGEAGWALDDSYERSGMPPVWWSGDGILSLIAVGNFEYQTPLQSSEQPTYLTASIRCFLSC